MRSIGGDSTTRAGWVTGIAIGVGIGIVAFVVFLFTLNRKGTLVIESEDPDAEITIKLDGKIVRERTLERELQLSPGEYTLESPKGKLSAERITLRSNRREVVRIQSEGSGPPVAGKPRPPRGKSNPRGVIQWVVSVGGSATIRVGKSESELRGAKATIPDSFQLVRIDLASRPVTDKEMAQLSELPDLEYLSLKNTRITDAGIEASLDGLPSLTQLELGSTQVTDAALACLDRLPNLHSLWLENTRVGDGALRSHIGKATGMKRLYLQNSAVTDAGLDALRSIMDLWELGLNNTQITDAGLEKLKELRTLRGLNLQGAKVSAEGVQGLRTALPGCNIPGVFPAKKPKK